MFPDVSIRVWDTDGEFLLIEAAYHLPRWVSPKNSSNRVFIRQGGLCIVPKRRLSFPTLLDSLSFLLDSYEEARASDSVQSAVQGRISEYPERARRNVHRVRVRIPVPVAQVLKHEPCLISLAVEGFYDRDIDTMKYAARMERFLGNGSSEELVLVAVTMSRAMYAQLVQQAFQEPKCYPKLERSDTSAFVEAALGMKIACGFEMMYQHRRRQGLDGKGSTWDAFRDSLEKNGHFDGLLPGSKDYKRLMESAEEYYRNSSLFSRASETLNAPVSRIDEILALPFSSDDFRGQKISPSDDDSWLYGGEDELNSALLGRQNEMELYDMKHKNKQKSKQQQDGVNCSSRKLDDFDLGDIAQSMQEFMDKVSSYEGAEVPESRNLKAVDFDVDRFMEDMGSVMRHPGCEDTDGDFDSEESSSSDMDFDVPDDEIDSAKTSEDNEGKQDAFMHSYDAVLDEELKDSTLKKSFLRASEQHEQLATENEGSSSAAQDLDSDFTPVDVDVNLVKSFLDSFTSQQGLPGPASNLLGLMGLQLPRDGVNKDK